MTVPIRSWHVERWAPMRADAEGVYLPAQDLPDANLGDRVEIGSRDGELVRSGVVAAFAEHDEQTFLRIELDD